jgi:hypothetical protein
VRLPGSACLLMPFCRCARLPFPCTLCLCNCGELINWTFVLVSCACGALMQGCLVQNMAMAVRQAIRPGVGCRGESLKLAFGIARDTCGARQLCSIKLCLLISTAFFGLPNVMTAISLNSPVRSAAFRCVNFVVLNAACMTLCCFFYCQFVFAC